MRAVEQTALCNFLASRRTTAAAVSRVGELDRSCELRIPTPLIGLLAIWPGGVCKRVLADMLVLALSRDGRPESPKTMILECDAGSRVEIRGVRWAPPRRDVAYEGSTVLRVGESYGQVSPLRGDYLLQHSHPRRPPRSPPGSHPMRFHSAIRRLLVSGNGYSMWRAVARAMPSPKQSATICKAMSIPADIPAEVIIFPAFTT